MLVRLSRSMARKKSRKAQFNQRIPAEHLGKTEGLRLEIPCGDEVIALTLKADSTHIRFSLRTSDPVEAITRQAQAGAYLEAIFAARSQSEPVLLTHRQAHAIAGELYRAWAADPDTVTPNLAAEVWRDESGTIQRRMYYEPMDAEDLAAALEGAARNLQAGHEQAREEGGRPSADAYLEANLGPLADKLLASKGIGKLTVESRRELLKTCFDGLLDGLKAQARKAGGDYRPDPTADRFPAWDAPVRASKPAQPKGIPLSDLYARWDAEAQRSPSTRDTYSRAFRMLEEHLGHGDTARITPEDIISFKDMRIAAGLNWKTVNEGDLAALHSVFEWAVKNKRMATNPAHGVKAVIKKSPKLRSKSFKEGEATAILSAALSTERGRKEPVERWAGRRWVPWLMAYTGARVGEMVQLRRQDVLQVDGIWCLDITPDAGPVKTGEARTIPLHEHLVEMGFPGFAQAAEREHLFRWMTRRRMRGEPRGIMHPVAIGSAKNEMQDFSRAATGLEVGAGVHPNHGWRHSFKTIGFEAGIQERVLDAINGHAPRNASQGYGEVTVKAMAKALEVFPRYTLT